MYAVVKIKGQQFRVEPGHTLQVPFMEGDEGASVTIDEVLMLADGEDVQVGSPNVEGATVTAEITRHGRSR
ncbi:50S ribosomal protein L21, partial [bacterium]|nr:50S ribosomal protein L21 [bacterium]